MLRDSKKLTKTSKVLLYLLAAQSVAADITRHRTLRDAVVPDQGAYFREKQLRNTLWRLQKQGWITERYVETQRIYTLTARGELEALLSKVKYADRTSAWDGKWRLVMFDIPEGARDIRKRLRLLLRSMGFHCLQASVYISPKPMSQEAVTLLRVTKLIRYIRLARANFDDDSDLRRLFGIRS